MKILNTVQILLKTRIRSSLPAFKKWITAVNRITIYEKKLESEGFFDASFYVSQYNDINVSRVTPLLRFLLQGVYEKRNPSSWFNTSLYLDMYADVRETGINPLFIIKNMVWLKSEPHTSLQRH